MRSAVADAWSDYRYASRRIIELSNGIPSAHRR
jgi:hypothetical protein